MDTRGPVTINGDVPKALKLIMIFIDRVGFPTLAFLLMFYISHVSMQKMTNALESNSMAMNEFKVSTKDFRETVLRDHTKLMADIDKIKEVSYGYQDWLNGKKKK